MSKSGSPYCSTIFELPQDTLHIKIENSLFIKELSGDSLHSVYVQARGTERVKGKFWTFIVFLLETSWSQKTVFTYAN